jgi:hypothetical protein
MKSKSHLAASLVKLAGSHCMFPFLLFGSPVYNTRDVGHALHFVASERCQHQASCHGGMDRDYLLNLRCFEY